jgi:hypothetical protein
MRRTSAGTEKCSSSATVRMGAPGLDSDHFPATAGRSSWSIHDKIGVLSNTLIGVSVLDFWFDTASTYSYPAACGPRRGRGRGPDRGFFERWPYSGGREWRISDDPRESEGISGPTFLVTPHIASLIRATYYLLVASGAPSHSGIALTLNAITGDRNWKPVSRRYDQDYG